jgi:SAM-dependent methyltransferase
MTKRALAGLCVALFACGASAEIPRPQELDTPFVVTPGNVVDAMLDIANVGAGDRLIDLGSGDGRIVIAAAKRGANALGVEIDPNLVARSRETARREGLRSRADFVTQDLFEIDFSGADVVTMYLLPDVNAKLRPKLFSELKPGARIVSHDYDMGEWPPDRTIVVDAPDKPVNAEKSSRVHFWRVPARIGGQWRGGVANRALVLDVRQHYQRVSGSVRWSGHDYRFEGQRIDGTQIALEAGSAGSAGLRLELRAQGDRLVGRLREGDGRPVEVQLHR